MVFARVFLLSLITVAVASPLNLVLHEQIQAPPEGFVQSGPAAASKMLNLRINLASSDMAGLEKALFDVSTPDNALYGQHLTKEEVSIG